jgi:hypothetical protein
MSRETRRTALAVAVIFLISVALNAALFLPGESKYRDSIEGGYASMARFVSENPNPFGWNPMQYFGMPTHMWYLPGVPYASALSMKLLPMLKPEHVYRLFVTTAACLLPVTAFLLAFYFSRSRRWALLATAGCLFLSPSYGLFYAVNWDRGITYLPWRMQILTKYGEGPHSTGLMLLPLALIFLWRTATQRRVSDIVIAAILMAFITLTNWVAALALAWCVLMMLVTGFGTAADTGFLARRIFGAATLAYAFACFWLTPEFVQVTLFNWPVDAFNYQVRTGQWVALGGLAAAIAAIRAISFRFPGYHYLTLLTLCCGGFFFIAAGHYWYGVDTIPESRRYAVEFELFLFLLLAELFRHMWTFRTPPKVFASGIFVGVLASFCLVPSVRQVTEYVTRGWIMSRPKPRQQTIEYTMAEYVNAQHPKGRIFASGGTRFRLNSWFLIPQVGGTFESGLHNRSALDLIYQIQTGAFREPAQWGPDALGLMRVAGVEYAIAHGRNSEEHWKNLKDERLFGGFPKPILERGDDRVYKIPYTGLANLVREEELLKHLPNGTNAGTTKEYVSAMDDQTRPRLTTVWRSNNEIEIMGEVPAGMWITLRVSHHQRWTATQDGEPVEIGADKIGFILLKPRPASQTKLVLRYHGSTQQYLFTGVSAVAWCGTAMFWWTDRKKRTPVG